MVADLEASCPMVAFFSSKILTLQAEAIHQVAADRLEEEDRSVVGARSVACHSVSVDVSASCPEVAFPLEAMVLQATDLEAASTVVWHQDLEAARPVPYERQDGSIMGHYLEACSCCSN